MAEGNSNNSVRDRISMLVDAQEGGVMRPNEVAQNNDTPKNQKNFLKVLIPVLAVAVVGVVVAIIVVNLPPSDVVEDVDFDDSEFQIAEKIGSIMEKVDNDDSYSGEDALSEFEDLLSEDVSNKEKVRIGVMYSYFIFDYYHDSALAMENLKRVSDYVEDDSKDIYNDAMNEFKEYKDIYSDSIDEGYNIYDREKE